MTKFRVALVGVLAFVLFATLPAAAFAGNPHFIKNATKVYIHDMCLHADFKEAGLESGSVETVTLKATAAVTYWSINGGDNHPQAANKETYVVELSKSGEFSADKNGNIEGFLCLAPPTAAQIGFEVPPGQTAVLVSVVYTNVVIMDEDSGAVMYFKDSFAYSDPRYVP